MSLFHVRAALPEDASAMAGLLFETVHAVNRRDYGEAELQAWAPRVLSAGEWLARQAGKRVFVAAENERLVGFAELDPDGHIDCFYTHKDRQGRGVGTMLLAAIEAEARTLGLAALSAEVSLTAQAFFARRGFQDVRDHVVVRRGVPLRNRVMEKPLRGSRLDPGGNNNVR